VIEKKQNKQQLENSIRDVKKFWGQLRRMAM